VDGAKLRRLINRLRASLCCFAIAFQLRKRYADGRVVSLLAAICPEAPEQWFFFAPVVLISMMIASR